MSILDHYSFNVYRSNNATWTEIQGSPFTPSPSDTSIILSNTVRSTDYYKIVISGANVSDSEYMKPASYKFFIGLQQSNDSSIPPEVQSSDLIDGEDNDIFYVNGNDRYFNGITTDPASKSNSNMSGYRGLVKYEYNNGETYTGDPTANDGQFEKIHVYVPVWAQSTLNSSHDPISTITYTHKFITMSVKQMAIQIAYYIHLNYQTEAPAYIPASALTPETTSGYTKGTELYNATTITDNGTIVALSNGTTVSAISNQNTLVITVEGVKKSIAANLMTNSDYDTAIYYKETSNNTDNSVVAYNSVPPPTYTNGYSKLERETYTLNASTTYDVVTTGAVTLSATNIASVTNSIGQTVLPSDNTYSLSSADTYTIITSSVGSAIVSAYNVMSITQTSGSAKALPSPSGTVFVNTLYGISVTNGVYTLSKDGTYIVTLTDLVSENGIKIKKESNTGTVTLDDATISTTNTTKQYDGEWSSGVIVISNDATAIVEPYNPNYSFTIARLDDLCSIDVTINLSSLTGLSGTANNYINIFIGDIRGFIVDYHDPSQPIVIVPDIDSNLNELRYTSIAYVPNGTYPGFYAVGKNPDENDTATHSSAYLADGTNKLLLTRMIQPSTSYDAYFRWGPVTRVGTNGVLWMSMNGWYNNDTEYYNDDKWYTIQWVSGGNIYINNDMTTGNEATILVWNTSTNAINSYVDGDMIIDATNENTRNQVLKVLAISNSGSSGTINITCSAQPTVINYGSAGSSTTTQITSSDYNFGSNNLTYITQATPPSNIAVYYHKTSNLAPTITDYYITTAPGSNGVSTLTFNNAEAVVYKTTGTENISGVPLSLDAISGSSYWQYDNTLDLYYVHLLTTNTNAGSISFSLGGGGNSDFTYYFKRSASDRQCTFNLSNGLSASIYGTDGNTLIASGITGQVALQNNYAWYGSPSQLKVVITNSTSSTGTMYNFGGFNTGDITVWDTVTEQDITISSSTTITVPAGSVASDFDFDIRIHRLEGTVVASGISNGSTFDLPETSSEAYTQEFKPTNVSALNNIGAVAYWQDACYCENIGAVVVGATSANSTSILSGISPTSCAIVMNSSGNWSSYYSLSSNAYCCCSNDDELDVSTSNDVNNYVLIGDCYGGDVYFTANVPIEISDGVYTFVITSGSPNVTVYASSGGVAVLYNPSSSTWSYLSTSGVSKAAGTYQLTVTDAPSGFTLYVDASDRVYIQMPMMADMLTYNNDTISKLHVEFPTFSIAQSSIPLKFVHGQYLYDTENTTNTKSCVMMLFGTTNGYIGDSETKEIMLTHVNGNQYTYLCTYDFSSITTSSTIPTSKIIQIKIDSESSTLQSATGYENIIVRDIAYGEEEVNGIIKRYFICTTNTLTTLLVFDVNNYTLTGTTTWIPLTITLQWSREDVSRTCLMGRICYGGGRFLIMNDNGKNGAVISIKDISTLLGA